MQPKTNGSHPPVPAVSYFSWSQPNRIIEMFAPQIPISAATSEMPTSWAITTIISVDDREYSTQRARLICWDRSRR
ncbi:Uncharacterised protein [Mycobacteroides abscessus subsp. abscessus]|nr:Uncharacterised protein [Mycobacteroides abscessus subsp. abscessus]